MRKSKKNLLILLACLWVLCLMFWYWQNNHGRVGGDISLVKAMWLFTTLSYFFVIPAWLWRDVTADPLTRKFAGLFFIGFLLRALIEMPLLAFTFYWRCWHGIAHDALMLALTAWWIFQSVRNCVSRLFPIAMVVVLLCEMWNAWMFGKMGSPETGVYFADDSARFALINQVTTGEIIICLTLLGVWLHRDGKDKSS